MEVNRDIKPPRNSARPSFDHDKTPVWFKVAAGVCLMVSMGILSFGVWAVYEIVQWVTSK